MKIAVCFSGQLRTGIENYQNIKEILSNIYDDCDFFIHTWDFCEYKSYNNSNISKKPIIEPSEKFKIIKQLYSPKKMIVEGKHREYVNILSCGIQTLWYSFWKSIQLKKEYELENNFKYDYVLKLRMDLILNHHSPIELLNEIITTKQNQFKLAQWYHSINLIEKNTPLSTDVFFIAKSDEMDIVANYVWFLMKEFRYNREYVNLIFYLKNKNIKCLPLSYVDRYMLLRDDFVKNGVLELNKSEMLKQVELLETYYYSSPELTNGNNFVNDLLIALAKKGIKLDNNTKYYYEDIFKLIHEPN